MKTTIDIPDHLMHQVREVARARGVTMRELMLEGLRTELGRTADEQAEVDFIFTAVDGDGRAAEIDADQAITASYGLPR